MSEQPAGSSDKFEPHFDLQDLNWVEYDTRQARDLEPDERNAAPEEEYERTRLGGLARLLMVLIVLAGVVAVISWWSSTTVKLQSQVSHKTPFSGRVPQEQGTRQTPAGAGSN
jgi:hypothetical protein